MKTPEEINRINAEYWENRAPIDYAVVAAEAEAKMLDMARALQAQSDLLPEVIDASNRDKQSELGKRSRSAKKEALVKSRFISAMRDARKVDEKCELKDFLDSVSAFSVNGLRLKPGTNGKYIVGVCDTDPDYLQDPDEPILKEEKKSHSTLNDWWVQAGKEKITERK